MEDAIIKTVGGFLLLAVGGLVGWVWALWQSHHSHKLEMATKIANCVTHPQLNNVLESFRKEFRFLRELTLRIADELKIKIRELHDE